MISVKEATKNYINGGKGKTTMLRDLIKNISNGVPRFRVSVKIWIIT